MAGTRRQDSTRANLAHSAWSTLLNGALPSVSAKVKDLDRRRIGRGFCQSPNRHIWPRPVMQECSPSTIEKLLQSTIRLRVEKRLTRFEPRWIFARYRPDHCGGLKGQ